jgi:hypothetical protein
LSLLFLNPNEERDNKVPPPYSQILARQHTHPKGDGESRELIFMTFLKSVKSVVKNLLFIFPFKLIKLAHHPLRHTSAQAV